MHFEGDRMQMVNMATKVKHALDGVAPWVAVDHPDFPGGVVCVSVHLGDSALPLRTPQTVGALEHSNLFRRGNLLSEHFEDLVDQFGEDALRAPSQRQECSNVSRRGLGLDHC